MRIQQYHADYANIAVESVATPEGNAHSQKKSANNKISYRGFFVDSSYTAGPVNVAAIMNQIDVIAEIGVYPQVYDFFSSRPITLHSDMGNQPGQFFPEIGIKLDAFLCFTNQPILLHELLHAFHLSRLPEGFENPDVLYFYKKVRKSKTYPASAYALSDAREFFAVTASIYLCGAEDRPPFTRKNIRVTQPDYYYWLGRQFGV